MKKGWLKRNWKNITSRGLSLGVMGLMATTSLWSPQDKDQSIPLESGISTPSTDIETPEELKADSHQPITTASIASNDFKTACNISIRNHDKYEYYCSLTQSLENSMGIDAFVLMAKLAMETGFRDTSHATHDARGVWQLQAAYTVTELRNFGQDLPFYQELSDESLLKQAIDGLVEQYDDATAEKQLTAQVTLIETFKKYEGSPLFYTELKDTSALKKAIDFLTDLNGDPNGVLKGKSPITIEEFNNPLMQALHDFRNNDIQSGQLVSAYALYHVPEAKASNFTKNWEDDYQARMDATLNVYAYHNMGKTGAPYQLAMINNEEWRTIRPIDSDVASIMSALGANNEWSTLSQKNLSRNADQNPPVYKFGKQDVIGCATANMTHHIQSTMAYLEININESHLTQWQRDFCTSDRMAPPVTISKIPKPRPNNTEAVKPQEITDKSQRMTSPIPKLRPSTTG